MSELPKEGPLGGSSPHRRRWWRIPIQALAAVAFGYLLHWPLSRFWAALAPDHTLRLWVTLGIVSLLPVSLPMTWDTHPPGPAYLRLITRDLPPPPPPVHPAGPLGVGLLFGIVSQAFAWNPLALYVAIPGFILTSTGWTHRDVSHRIATPEDSAVIPIGLTLGYALAWAAGTVWRALG